MFKDYYQILGVLPSATKQEIKQAYRQMSLRWHPDKNPGIDVTEMMQDINEAYKILYDDISRARYDKEYLRFTQQHDQSTSYQQKAKTEHKQNTKSSSEAKSESKSQSWYYDYEVKDENLKNDINEARQYAKTLVEEFFKSLKQTSKDAVKGAWDGAYGYIIGGLFATILFALIRACH